MKKCVWVISCFFCFAQYVLCSEPEEFPKGKIIENVLCQIDADQSYALYLPTTYTPSSSWPVLYALDPGARGRVPVERYKNAAEKFQFVLIGSNTARNGPFTPIYTAVLSMWKDTRERFSLNEKRVYVTGFSGGARAASAFSQITGSQVAAVIGCGAGLHSMLNPHEMNSAYYVGVVGTEDFNYLEIHQLIDTLSEAGIDHRLFVFQGGHTWPSEELCMEIWTWLEIFALNTDIQSEGAAFIDPVLQSEIARAKKLKSQGCLYQAVRIYETVIPVFQNLHPIHEIKSEILQIKEDPGYVKSRSLYQDHIRAEQTQVNTYRRLLLALEQQPQMSELALNRLLTESGFDGHKKAARTGLDTASRAQALRLLFGLEMDARSMGFKYQEKNEFTLAARYFELAVRANMDILSRRMFLHFRLALVYAKAQAWEQALTALKDAAEDGWQDTDILENESAFDGLRKMNAFKTLIQEMKKKKN